MNILQNLSIHKINKLTSFKKTGLQPPLNNVLNKVASKTIEKNQKNSNYEHKLKMSELDIDTYLKTKTSGALEDLPVEILKYYSGSLQFLSKLSGDHEKELISFKEQLISYDKDIQTYQDIANGNESLPAGFTKGDIDNLITKTQQTRNKYLEEGLKKINKWDIYKSDFFNSTVNRVLGEGSLEAMNNDFEINTISSDIYAEIDKVIKSTKGMTQTLNKGISRIQDILEDRGDDIDKYKLHQSLSAQNTSLSSNTKTIPNLDLLLASIKNKTQF